jgi:NADPH:quinone reductase-like Zn-dependent oxidoreductase
MSKAILFGRLGRPEALNLAGEVLIDMLPIGVNRSDTAFRTSKYLIQAPFPAAGLGQ